MYGITPRSNISSIQLKSAGHSPGSTVFLPSWCAQYAALPIISLKTRHSGSSRLSHSLWLFGSFHSSIHSNSPPNRETITSMKSAYALGVWGGDENFGTIPRHGGVYTNVGRIFTSLASRGSSQ